MNDLTQQELSEYFSAGQVGFWKIEEESGKPVRLYADANLRRMLGIPDEAEPEKCHELLEARTNPEDRHLLAEHRVDAGNGETVIEYRYDHPERGEIYIRCSGRRIKNENGVAVTMGFDQELTDVIRLGTAQTRESQLLRENRSLQSEKRRSESYRDNMMDMAACGIIVYTLPERRILHMNAEALRIYGAENEKEARAIMTEMIKRTVYTDPVTVKKLMRLRDENGTVDYECTVTNHAGYSTSLIARSRVMMTPQGERAVITTFIDVSENKALKSEKEILEALCVDYTAVYLCDIASDGIVPIKCTLPTEQHVAESVLGENSASFSGRMRLFYDYLLMKESAPDFLEKMSGQYITEYLSKHDRFAYRFRAKPTEQGHQYFEAQAVRLGGGNDCRIVLGIRYIDDILREEERQKSLLENAVREAQQANEAKTEFLRRMSHDIRTPINGIMGMLRIAERHTDDAEKVRDCTKKAISASQQLLTLVSDILDIGKLESDEIIVENIPFDMIPLLREQIAATRTYAEQHGVTVYSGKSDCRVEHSHVIGSAQLLNRVLMNLASNAVKYNRPGGNVRLSCSEQPRGDGTSVYEFICEDTGIGMSEEFQKRAFEPYSQEGKRSNTSFSGTGLGLAIVKKIVEQLGGTIELESRENVGSRFTVSVPFAIDTAEHPCEDKCKGGAGVKLTGKKALLAEDNELNREIAESLLSELGIDTVSVKNGKEALERFEASAPGEFDFVLLDVMMPVMDGVEAARRIRTLERADAAEVPIMAISANAFQDDIRRSLEAGMTAHLTKPLEIEKIRRALQEAAAARKAT